MAGTDTKRLTFGAASTGGMLQTKINEMFHGLPNIFGIADDILIADFDEL